MPSTDIVMATDTPMHRTTVAEMTDEQLTDLVVNRRERRLRAYKMNEELARLEKEAKSVKMVAELKKQRTMMDKDIATIDKALERIEKRSIKIMTIKNELGMEDTNGSQSA